MTVPPNLLVVPEGTCEDKLYRMLNPQVPCVTTCQSVARHCYVAPALINHMCSSTLYVTLRNRLLKKEGTVRSRRG